MADEINLTLRLQVANGSYTELFNPPRITIDQTGLGAASGIIQVGTSEEDLAPTDITTEGLLVLQNLDGTNHVTYGPKDGTAMVAFGKIKPGEVAALRLEPTTVIRWQADTAEVKVFYLLLED